MTAFPDQRDSLEAHWMPFTANRQFKARPRLLAKASGMHYHTPEGRQILDAVAGLWCVNAGHGREEISAAVSKQIREMEYAPFFQMGHPLAFEFANRLVELSPDPLNHVFFTNSGSESVDTALKIALAWQRVRGEASRTRLIGRAKGYHGVGFGGISVGGISNNRKFFGALLPGCDHLPHTHDLKRNAFSRGQPQHGVELADELERMVELHDASTIAAVIVEPVAGSAGVLVPPVGYLQRLREICDRHGILLIFDEVITGFGRLGAPFAAQHFGVTPDLITTAKGITSGAIPMGAVFVRDTIHDDFMHGADGAIELFHGYTFSGHPVACAAGMAALDIYAKDKLFERAATLSPVWENMLHGLRDLPGVIDVRNCGLMGAVELAPLKNQPTARAYDVFLRCFDNGVMVRFTGDTIALSPPLIIQEEHIAEIGNTLGKAIRAAFDS